MRFFKTDELTAAEARLGSIGIGAVSRLPPTVETGPYTAVP